MREGESNLKSIYAGFTGAAAGCSAQQPPATRLRPAAQSCAMAFQDPPAGPGSAHWRTARHSGGRAENAETLASAGVYTREREST